MTSLAPTSPRARPREERLPSLFATDTQLFGWQGLTVTLPSNWCLTSFGGDALQGNLRIDDEEVPRLELRWEQPKHAVDLDRSIEKFLDSLARDAHKRGDAFEVSPQPRVVSRSKKRKEKLISFGWTGEQAAPVGQGWGMVWKCAECGRVVVGHVMGRGAENHESVQRLAGEVLSSLECHGSGGWQTWSLFGLRVEIPEEFVLGRARLMTGRMEINWVRPRVAGLRGLLRRDETLGLIRVSLADVLLEHDTLEQWAAAKLSRNSKAWYFARFVATEVRGHPAVESEGVLRDLRLHVRTALIDLVCRRRSPRALLRVWHCEAGNKIYALLSDVAPINHGAVADVVDSLECHS